MSKNKTENWGNAAHAILIAVTIGTSGFLLGKLSGFKNGQQFMKDQAVRYDKAEYYLDEKNEKQWRWEYH